jgi:tRNA(adenine34) deaminase
LQAIRQAAVALGSRRLLDTVLYVTLEPCAMCAGAVVLARIPRLVFGAFDPKAGACGSLHNLVQDSRLNHRCTLVGGVLEGESAELLKEFFSRLRSRE